MGSFNEILTKLYGNRRFNLIAFGLIALMIFIAYSNTYTSSFHFDDNPAIVENYSIKRMSMENLKAIFHGSRPIVNLSLMLNYYFGGLNVVGYHIFNIAVHIANSILLYLLVLWTLKLPQSETRYREKAPVMALFAALLFALHPIQTESVTYIITRTELLAMFFYLATFLLFIQGVRKNRFRYHLGACVTAFLAVGSKEWAVTLPAVLFIYDILFLSDGRVRPALSRWKTYLLIALSWVQLVYTLDLSSATNSTVGFHVVTTSGSSITPLTYFLTSANIIWTYIRLFFIPINQNLDYDYPLAQTLLEFPTLVSFLGHIAVIGLAFWLYKKRGWTLIPFGVAWFYIGLSPTQSVVPIKDVIFEHRVYMPSAGFFLAFVSGYVDIFTWLQKRFVAPKTSAPQEAK